MALAWKDVAAKPEFQSLSPEQKVQAQTQYFNEVVAPKAGDSAGEAKQQFFSQYNYQQQEPQQKDPSRFGGQGDVEPTFQLTPEMQARKQQEQQQEEYNASPKGQSENAINQGAQMVQQEPQDSGITDSLMAPVGLGEVGLQALTGTASDVAGGIAGGLSAAYDAVTGGDYKTGAKIIKDMHEKFTYQPRTQAGKELESGIGKVVGSVMDPVQHVADKSADYIRQKTGSPELAAIVQSAPQAASALIPGEKVVGAIGKGIRGESRAAEQVARDIPPETAQPSIPTRESQPGEIQLPGEEPGFVPGPEQPALPTEDAPQKIAEAARATGRKQGAKAEEAAYRVDPDIERVDAAKRLGIHEELLPSSVSQNQQYIEIERGLASIPGSKLSATAKRETEAIARKADDLITEFGGTVDKAELSDRLKSSIDTSIKDLDKKSEDIYKTIGNTIPRKAKVDTSSIKDSILKEADDLGGVEHLEPVEKKLLKISSMEGGPSYALIDKERKSIGQALRKGTGPYKDANTGILKRAYGQLTEAQEGTAGAHGMDESWQAAKNLVIKRKQLEDNSVKLLGKNLTGAIMPQVGGAVKKLTTGDYKKFDETMNAIPKSERQEVVLTALNDAFTMGSRKEKQLSVPGFVDWMEGLNRNPAAKARIYKHLPEGAGKRLDDMHTVSKGIRNAQAEKITTGRITALLKDYDKTDGLLGKLYGAGVKGAAGAAAGAFAGPVGMKVGAALNATGELLTRRKKDPITDAADDLLSSSEFKKAVNEFAKEPTEKKKEFINKSMSKSPRVKRWLKALGSDEAKRISQMGVMSYLTGDKDAD